MALMCVRDGLALPFLFNPVPVPGPATFVKKEARNMRKAD